MARRRAARVHTKFAQGSNAILPGSYEINHIRLTANNGEDFDILDLVAQIKIYESLDTPSINVQMFILDAGNYFEKLKISGNERIDLSIARRDIEGEAISIDTELYVANMSYFKKTSPGNVTYMLTCVSKQAYMNQLQVLSRPFEDSPGPLVQRICEDDLQIEPGFINTDTKEIIKGVYPRMRPLTLIDWLRRRAFDNGSPHYFYDTYNQGVMFESLENMQNADAYETFIFEPFQTGVPGSSENYEMRRTQILELGTDNMSISKFTPAARGGYASTLHKLDIANKKYEIAKYNYNDKKMLKLNDNKPLPDDVMFNDRKIEDYNEAKHFYVSLNSLSHGNISNYHAPAADSIIQANAYVTNLNSLEITIQIHGDFEIASGKKLNIVVRKGVDRQRSQESTEDQYLSGNYIIHSITHDFAESYIQTVTLRKDSYIESMNNIIEKES